MGPWDGDRLTLGVLHARLRGTQLVEECIWTTLCTNPIKGGSRIQSKNTEYEFRDLGDPGVTIMADQAHVPEQRSENLHGQEAIRGQQLADPNRTKRTNHKPPCQHQTTHKGSSIYTLELPMSIILAHTQNGSIRSQSPLRPGTALDNTAVLI